MTPAKPKTPKQKYHDALDDLLDRPIAYNPAFRKITGRTSAAVWLSQQWYWAKRTSNPDGWVYKSARECTEETGLTDNEQVTARNICKALGIVEEDLRGVPATLHYRINKQKIYEMLGVQFPTQQETEVPEQQETEIPAEPETSFPAGREFPGEQETDPAGNFNKESEITPKIPTENTDQMDFSKHWETILAQLKPDRRNGSFELNTAGTRVLRYDSNGLVVACADETARTWLEGNLKTAAEKTLIGILKQEVTVQFVLFDEVPA